MPASSLDSEFRDGVIRVVPEAGGIIAVCLKGEFDLANVPPLDDGLTRALETTTGLIVDLSEATFVDSTVIEVLVRTAKTAARRDKTVVLQLRPATIVERIIEIVGIERVVPCSHDRQNAVRIIQENHGASLGSDGSAPDAHEGAGDATPTRLIGLTHVNTSIFEVASASIVQGVTWDFFCECGDPDCDARIVLTIDEYEQIRDGGRAILAGGHEPKVQGRAGALQEDVLAPRVRGTRRVRKNRARDDEPSRMR